MSLVNWTLIKIYKITRAISVGVGNFLCYHKRLVWTLNIKAIYSRHDIYFPRGKYFLAKDNVREKGSKRVSELYFWQTIGIFIKNISLDLASYIEIWWKRHVITINQFSSKGHYFHLYCLTQFMCGLVHLLLEFSFLWFRFRTIYHLFSTTEQRKIILPSKV